MIVAVWHHWRYSEDQWAQVAKALNTDANTERFTRDNLEQRVRRALGVIDGCESGYFDYRQKVERLQKAERVLKDFCREFFGTFDPWKAQQLSAFVRECEDEFQDALPSVGAQSLDERVATAVQQLHAMIVSGVRENEFAAERDLMWTGAGRIPTVGRLPDDAIDRVIRTACWAYRGAHGRLPRAQSKRNSDGRLTGAFNRYMEAALAPLPDCPSWSALTKRVDKVSKALGRAGDQWPWISDQQK